ncbi:helix-turn-helix domain-containing protein [Dysgonomonas sp. 25]|uniref:helix-turn-helix domain-containing protein n=1 Tax=Dysgonomonas sp. 25 TaxID=2302933 RepID=UPI0013D57FB0|nr:helix-turn-helix domain-containing protein [Dysgonomonas sp. 25]NDV68936.1 DUF3853 family protein [Dysgonomonas sp. 25]
MKNMNAKEQPTVNIGGTVYAPIDIDEIREMIHIAVESAVKKNTRSSPTQKKFIKGIHELAKFLNVSPSKAQEIKNSGIIPYTQNGRIVLFDPDRVIEALEKNKARR